MASFRSALYRPEPKAEMTKSHLIRDVCSGSSIHLGKCYILHAPYIAFIGIKKVLLWLRIFLWSYHWTLYTNKGYFASIKNTHTKRKIAHFMNLLSFSGGCQFQTTTAKYYHYLFWAATDHELAGSSCLHLPSSSCSVLWNLMAATLPPLMTTSWGDMKGMNSHLGGGYRGHRCHPPNREQT